ncbi:MAG: chromosomal replication initiator protein DnaA [Spirochaetaceae bacterium]|jgi:chromosomal replication initiator protein|nr:chromosomal replication initiator protein DnaA [Spirochaetaceae bacterium]
MTDFKDYKALWNETMQQLKCQFGTQPMDWWTSLKYTSSSEDEIFIAAPSAYHRDQVKSRFMAHIDTKIMELTGKPLKITITEKQSKKSAKNIVDETKKPAEENNFVSEVPDKTPDPVNVTKHSETKAAIQKNRHFQLKNEFTFDTFIVSEKNKYTFAAAQAVARNLGTSYNPLLIYGGVGLGKTHLMQAIGNYVHSNSDNNIIYISAENFMNEFIESINDKKTASSFRNKYRHTDLLMIDDIHSLKYGDATLAEIFNTYEALHNANKQMIFTCDRPVSELKNLTDRLKSRFESGLNVEICLPDYETRFAIAKSRIKLCGINIPDDVISFVCKNITTNVRDLISALKKLFSYADLMAKPVTLEIAQQQLRDTIVSTKQTNVSTDVIIRIVAEYFSLTPTDLRSKKKSHNIVHPRHLSMYIIRDLTELSTTDIGEVLGGRDHTTVMNGIDKIEKRILSDPTEEPMIQTLKRMIKENYVK